MVSGSRCRHLSSSHGLDASMLATGPTLAHDVLADRSVT